MVEGEPIVPAGLVRSGPTSPDGQQLDLFRTVDIALIGDSIALVDNGNDRIILLDSALNVLWIRGRTGAGPGEFEAPFGVAASPVGLVTVDFGNSRFTELDREGNLVRTIPAPSASRAFGVRSDGAIVTPNRGATHYAFVVQDGEETPFAERPDTTNAAETVGTLARTAALAVTAGDTVHVMDGLMAELLKYDSDGRLVQRALLPRALVDSVRHRSEGRREAFARQGLRPLPSSLTKDMTLSSDGSLLIAIAAANTVGFLVDPHTYSARRIVIPSDDSEWSPLKNASSIIKLGDRLFALQGDSVFVFDIAGR